MKSLAYVTVLAGMAIGAAQADVMTIAENNGSGSPILNLSTIVDQWGTPSDTTSAFQIGGPGTDFLHGLYMVNDLGFTITSLQVYVYGLYSDTAHPSTLKYQCGVNNFFNSCTPNTQQTLPDPSTISQNSPLEFNYSGLDATHSGIANGVNFHLVDTIGGTDGSNTRLFFEIEVNGNPFTPTAATPEPSTVIPLGAGLVAMGLAVSRRRKVAATN